MYILMRVGIMWMLACILTHRFLIYFTPDAIFNAVICIKVRTFIIDCQFAGLLLFAMGYLLHVSKKQK